MKKFRLVSVIALITAALLCLSGCIQVNVIVTEKAEESAPEKSGDITIVYTNDTHSYIANVADDEEDEERDGLRFSKIAAMVEDLRDAGENVLLVDAGDEIQGNIYGAIDEGSTVIDILNATGYQLATIGNHEFDYGVDHLLELTDEAEFPYISCNFKAADGSDLKYADSYIFDVAGKKVAFIGILTPETIASSSPAYFKNDEGEYLYKIVGMDNPDDLMDCVQKAIDEVRSEADYVIALGHVGIGRDAKDKGISSEDIIESVSGLDAFIDGHSHSTVEGVTVKDKDGKDVILTQTGYYMQAFGVMTISEDGTISAKLVDDYDREDEEVAALEKKWIQDVTGQMSEQTGILDSPLYICNPDNNKERWIRAKEMNMGDFAADAIYWYCNEEKSIDCDIAFQNGGGIRSNIEAGDLDYMSAKSVEPFGNMICVISATGQQIIDALEMGANVVGEWDDEWNSPAEFGGFMHVAGLSYTIDAAIPSGLMTDSEGLFKSVDGEYRVKDVKVYNKETGEYEDINPEREYRLAGIRYTLQNCGDGLSMFENDELIADDIEVDYVVLSEYIKSFAAEDGEYPHVNSANCPLSSYEGYLLDYENPLGAGRITILNVLY